MKWYQQKTKQAYKAKRRYFLSAFFFFTNKGACFLLSIDAWNERTEMYLWKRQNKIGASLFVIVSIDLKTNIVGEGKAFANVFEGSFFCVIFFLLFPSVVCGLVKAISTFITFWCVNIVVQNVSSSISLLNSNICYHESRCGRFRSKLELFFVQFE